MREDEIDRQGLSQSLWAATAVPAPDCPALEGEARADVCIVGGGFAGLSAALHLAEKGAEVRLLETHQPGWGASGRNGGQVIAGLKYDLAELTAKLGPDLAERTIAFADRTADTTFDLIARHGIDCDAAQGGWVQGAHGPGPLRDLEKKAAALQARGQDVELLDKAAVEKLTGTDWYPGGLMDRRNGTVQPLSYARGLARAAQKAGAVLHGDSMVTGLTKSSSGWRVETKTGAVSAEKVLLCTNGYSDRGDLVSGITRSVVPFFSYQIATKPLSDNVLRSLPADGLGVSETRRILSYYRVDRHGRFLMGARGALDGNLGDAAFDLARARLKALYPRLADAPLEYRWNGRVAVTPDFMPRLVNAEPGLYAALGWNGRGVAITGAMGPVLAEWLSGGDEQDLPLPVTGPTPIPFHWLKRPASGLAVAWKNFQDTRERD